MSLKKIIDKTIDAALIFILAAMSIIVAINVFSRFILNHSIYWGDELALVLFVWLTFLGAAVALREGEHYVFGFFANRLKGKALKIYQLTGEIITTFAVVVLLYYSSQVTYQINSWIMPALEISRSLVYGAAPVGCLFMLYYLGINFYKQTKQFNS